MATQQRQPEPGYDDAVFSLRAPRIAIVFPADTPHWYFFARAALWRANQYWGGAGFVLVPHRGGKVSITVLRAVAAYDPDYVVTHDVTWRELLAAHPDVAATLGGRGVDLSRLGQSEEAAPHDDTVSARDAVASVCQVYRLRLDDERVAPPEDDAPAPWNHGWDDPIESLQFLDDTDELTNISAFGVGEMVCLAAPADLDGPWGAWAAATAGATTRPSLPAASKPVLDDAAADLAAWFLARADSVGVFRTSPPDLLAHHPDGLRLAHDASTLPTSWSRTTQGLVPVGRPSRARTTIVVGDDADDFALALICDRVWGETLWLPSTWGPEAEGRLGQRSRMALASIGSTATRRGTVVITTATATDEQLLEIKRLVEKRHEQEAGVVVDGDVPTDPAPFSAPRRGSGRRRELVVVQNPPELDVATMRRLAVNEEYSRSFTLPVTRDDSSTALASTPPALRPSDPQFATVDLTWHVDVHLHETTMPAGRDIDGRRLLASRFKDETWVRSGNRSISFECPRRMGVVSSGANSEQRLARPRLQFLTMLGWCHERAGRAGYDIGWSDAGRRAKLLESLWGSRAEMVADFAGIFTPLARAFEPSSSKTEDAYPDGSGVVVSGDGCLTFAAIRDVLVPAPTVDVVPLAGAGDDGQADVDSSSLEEGSGDSVGDDARRRNRAVESVESVAATPVEQENEASVADRTLRARTMLDTYLERGIIRRGLVLGCGTCEQLNFIPVDDLGQQTTCSRCNARTGLTRESWKMPACEPTWFYDLHEVARRFVENNGHGPALLAAHLSRKARHYDDCAELNLLRPGTRNSVAEVDLVALVDGTLITAEVKTNDTLGTAKGERQRAALKRIRWAAAIQADEIVLATTAPAWSEASIEAVRGELGYWIRQNVFSPDRTPRLRRICGLGTGDVEDTYVEV